MLLDEKNERIEGNRKKEGGKTKKNNNKEGSELSKIKEEKEKLKIPLIIERFPRNDN